MFIQILCAFSFWVKNWKNNVLTKKMHNFGNELYLYS